MADGADWTVSTWEGSRRHQHGRFLALPFHEKVAAIEELAELAAYFAARRGVRELEANPPGAVRTRVGEA